MHRSTDDDPGLPATEPASQVAARLVDAVGTAIRGKTEVVRLSVSSLLAGGHLLLADAPGTGKTLLAKSLAAAIGGRFGRVQCTPDLLPSDLTGTSVYEPGAGSWSFRPGPVFANVLLVDEINRASPRTQAALLEPMEERQVTVDGASRSLPSPFLCIATQNPNGQIGTFPLPESQLDRFALVLSVGLPDREAEREILTGTGGVGALARIGQVTTPRGVAAAIDEIGTVHCAPAVIDYLLDLIAATRRHPDLTTGASPRAAVGLLAVSRAHAVICGRNYVTPDDVQALAVPSLVHRVAVGGRLDLAAAAVVIRGIVQSIPAPRA